MNLIRYKRSLFSHLELSSNPEPSALTLEQMDRNGKTVVAPQLFGLDADIDIGIPNAQQQLWLDLRGTALFPNEAMLFLQEQCLRGRDDDARSILCKYVDVVLVSSSQMDAILATDRDDSGIYDYMLLYTTAKDEELILNIPSTQQSIPVGRIVPCQAERPNIMASHNMVVQQRQWILLKEAGKSSSNAAATPMSPWMLKQIAELLQFMFTAGTGLAPEDFAASDSGLLLPDTTKTKSRAIADRTKGNEKHGGVAMVCTDRSSLFEIDATLAEVRQSSRWTRTTSSGLSIPNDAAAAEEADEEGNPTFGTALVLPLDVSLWETALNMRMMNDENVQ
jgi:hypothetical protein